MLKPYKRTESDFPRHRSRPESIFSHPTGIDPIHGRPAVLLTLALLAGGFAFLYLNLFYLPNTPIHLFVDQFTLLFDARRMFGGQMIYRDFFQFTLPATQVVYLFLFKIFGVRTWIPNAMLIVLGVGTMG